MKVLCTGSSGFIGSKVVDRLSNTGNEVTTFDIVDGKDIRNLRQVKAAVKGKDAVFHLAAIADLDWAYDHPAETMEINVKGTWNMAIACQEAGARLYYASTCCLFGNQKTHPSTEESPINPSEIYACSKAAGEDAIMGIHHSFGLQYNMMRFATIYGPGAREALATHKFLKQATKGVPITVHGDGKQTRTQTYIDDLIDAVEALWKSQKINNIWNLSTEEQISAIQMAKDAKRITGSKSEIVHVAQRIGQTFHEEISAQKMLRETGWKAKVGWEDGMQKMWEWYQKTNGDMSK
jgi:UDP-glucose 4-epimerase